MGLVKNILEWNDKKLEQLLNKEKLDVKTAVKVAANGAIEGFVDGCFVVGASFAVLGLASTIIDTIKK